MRRYFPFIILLIISFSLLYPLGTVMAATDEADDFSSGAESGEAVVEESDGDSADSVEVEEYEYEEVDEDFYKAEVTEIVEEKTLEFDDDSRDVQIVKVKLLEGPDEGEEFEIEYGSIYSITEEQKLKTGEKVIVSQTSIAGDVSYFIEDKYRIDTLIIALVIFVIIILAFGGFKGITSILGLVFSIFILLKFIVPQILEGHNPLIISFIGSFIILVVSLYLAHGFNRISSYAVLSSVITLVLAFAIAMAFVFFTKLSGTGSEGAFILQSTGDQPINLRGLLMGAMIIGALGVLDDVTVGQTNVVNELKKANSKLKDKDLYSRAITVGREHVASMVNTLVLAYAGTALPLFILFTLNENANSWVTLNSEFVAEEIVRALVGSISLALAVPIATFVAVMFISRKSSVPSLKLVSKDNKKEKDKK